MQLQFVVDGNWITDSTAREEDDGCNNINNVLLPEEIKRPAPPIEDDTTTEDSITIDDGTTTEDGAVAEDSAAVEEGAATFTGGAASATVMSGVTPDSTTAALAAQVPKESERRPEEAPGAATISSAAPESTTAELAKEVPLENKAEDLPGSFPETPAAKEPELFSVNPIPATSGIGNPVQLSPGETVPHPSTITTNTVQSTVTTDQAGYERNASAPIVPGLAPAEAREGVSSAFNVPPANTTIIPESSLPMSPPATDTTDPGVTFQSAAPISTTAALAAQVPLEPRDKDKGKDKPNGEAETPAGEVPDVVRRSLEQAHTEPEAAADEEAVESKKEVEDELKDKLKPDESLGQPAPTDSAITAETAPAPTDHDQLQQADLPARDKSPVSAAEPPPSEPTVTTGVAEAKTTEVSTPKDAAAAAPAEPAEGAAEGAAAAPSTPTPAPEDKKETKDTDESKDKKKKRGFFSKLKGKFK